MPAQQRSRRAAVRASSHVTNVVTHQEGPTRLLPLLTSLTVMLAACGGGGGGGAAPAQVVAPVGLDNVCAAPRSGIDPATGKAFTDKPGSVEQEKTWVRNYIDDTYLWFDEIPASVVAANYTTPQTYFDALRTPLRTGSGQLKDRFHFYQDTAAWQALAQSGATAGYGFEVVVIKSVPPREVRVAFTEPNTPATAAGITRGSRVFAVDGVDAVNSTGAAPIAVLNAGITPAKAGEVHSFTFQDVGGSFRTVSLTSKVIASTPVQNVKVLVTPTGPVGYLLFNDHVATSEAPLIAAISQLKAAGVSDLVIDVRYNGGGYLAIASELAYMVASPAATTGTVFERLLFNSKNPFGATALDAATPFYPVSQGLSTTRGQALPQLGLNRVTLLTGPGTCSASESIANGLRGVNVRVDLIGETTCGKPYGFLPQDNCGTTYFAIQFKGVNNKGLADYEDGLAPTCRVADDFSRALGDPLEGRLAAALNYRATGICPAPSSTFAKATVLQSEKSVDSSSVLALPGRSGKILRPAD
jgi:carboxyl-terminal processing protease